MKLGQARKVVSVLLAKGQVRLAKTFAASITSKTAQEEFNEKIATHNSNRDIKNRTGSVNKSGKELDKAQKTSTPDRKVKESPSKGDPVGQEFKSKKRDAEVTMTE